MPTKKPLPSETASEIVRRCAAGEDFAAVGRDLALPKKTVVGYWNGCASAKERLERKLCLPEAASNPVGRPRAEGRSPQPENAADNSTDNSLGITKNPSRNTFLFEDSPIARADHGSPKRAMPVREPFGFSTIGCSALYAMNSG